MPIPGKRYICFIFPQGSSGTKQKRHGRSRHSVIEVIKVKVIERCVHDSLYDFLQVNNLIYFRQSGFRKHYGTEAALIKIVDELLLNVDNNRVSGVLLVDFSKAFDMVDHNVLLLKLAIEAYGVNDRAYDWCQSYLSGRRRSVGLHWWQEFVLARPVFTMVHEYHKDLF